MNQFWFQDPAVLLSEPLVFFPNKKLDTASNLNAMVRFGVYASVILAMYNRNVELLLLSLIPIILSYLIYMYLDNFDSSSEYLKVKEKGEYTLPTLNNPTMNVLVGEYTNPDRKPAYPIGDESEEAYYMKKDVENKLNFNFFTDPNDTHNNRLNQRNFYTMPNTSVPSDRETFLKFLQKDTPMTCKENRYNCGNYDDPRFHSSMESLLPDHQKAVNNLL